MTTITHPATKQIRRTPLRDRARRPAAAFAARIRSLMARLQGMAAAGQLGPGQEVEVGRWTGARV